jgi:hypothetical protein
MTKNEAQLAIVIDGLDEANFKSGDSNSRALVALLKEYKDMVPVFDDYFHKSFEKKQVTGISGVDEAMWHLIRSNQTFWRLFESATRRYK